MHYAAMAAICENPGIDVTRLSSLIAFDRSTLGSVLERLEARKLVERYPSPEDKRINQGTQVRRFRLNLAHTHRPEVRASGSE